MTRSRQAGGWPAPPSGLTSLPTPQGTTPLLPHPGPWGSAPGQLPREGEEGVGRGGPPSGQGPLEELCSVVKCLLQICSAVASV